MTPGIMYLLCSRHWFKFASVNAKKFQFGVKTLIELEIMLARAKPTITIA